MYISDILTTVEKLPQLVDMTLVEKPFLQTGQNDFFRRPSTPTVLSFKAYENTRFLQADISPACKNNFRSRHLYLCRRYTHMPAKMLSAKKKSHHPHPPSLSPLRPRHRRPSARTRRERERKGRGAAPPPPPPPKEGSRRCLHDDKEDDHEQHEQGAPSPHHHRIHRPHASRSPDPPHPCITVAGSAIPHVCRSRIHHSRTSLLPDPTTPAIEPCTTATERHGCSLPHHRR